MWRVTYQSKETKAIGVSFLMPIGEACDYLEIFDDALYIKHVRRSYLTIKRHSWIHKILRFLCGAKG